MGDNLMGSQRLNDKNTRKIERLTGLTLLRAWAHGGYVHDFVTPAHRHGWFDKKTGTWGWETNVMHYTSCHEMFPDWVPEPPPKPRPALNFGSQQSVRPEPLVIDVGAASRRIRAQS